MFRISWIIDIHTQHSYIGHCNIWHCLKMSEYDSYLAISLFGHLFPGIAKNAFPLLTIFKFLWSRGLRLIAVNMHYAKFTLWTPKLQILAKTLIHVPVRVPACMTEYWNSNSTFLDHTQTVYFWRGIRLEGVMVIVIWTFLNLSFRQ